MKTASITQTKNRLSAFIDEVRRGETILILDRGTPVARLVAATAEAEAGEAGVGRVERLERSGVVRRAERLPARGAKTPQPARLPAGASVLECLLAEREEGR